MTLDEALREIERREEMLAHDKTRIAELERLVRGADGIHVVVRCGACGNTGSAQVKIGPMLEGTVELPATEPP